MRSNRLWGHFPLIVTLVGLSSTATSDAADNPMVHFDLPPIAAASAAESAPTDPTLVTVQLRLSSMIESPQVPTIDQWLVRCQPRDNFVAVEDYAPKTETASDVTSPIQVKQTEEKSQAYGLSIDGSYGKIAHGNAGADHGKKNVNTIEFHRQAPVQAVTASGTINRGRGVYFKLRWTAQQILEGEKTFHLTLRVPPSWRGGLIDVSVVAQAQAKSFGWERDTKVIGAASFVVAAYRVGDEQAEMQARELAAAEYSLRRLARTHQPTKSVSSLPSMLRQVAIKLDWEPNEPDTRWIQRFLLGQADPYLDDAISKLPMPVRIAALDYADIRQEFSSMSQGIAPLHSDDQDRVLVAKPAP